MQKHKLKTAVMVCAAASLAAGVVPASASAVSQPSGDVVIVDCFSQPQVRPDDFLLACGDGNNRLTELRWSSWGPTSAVGRGRDLVNDCQPYCAAGTFRSYPVIVRLDRPEQWEKHPGQQHYTRLSLVYTDSRPAQTEREVTSPLWD